MLHSSSIVVIRRAVLRLTATAAPSAAASAATDFTVRRHLGLLQFRELVEIAKILFQNSVFNSASSKYHSVTSSIIEFFSMITDQMTIVWCAPFTIV